MSKVTYSHTDSDDGMEYYISCNRGDGNFSMTGEHVVSRLRELELELYEKSNIIENRNKLIRELRDENTDLRVLVQ